MWKERIIGHNRSWAPFSTFITVLVKKYASCIFNLCEITSASRIFLIAIALGSDVWLKIFFYLIVINWVWILRNIFKSLILSYHIFKIHRASSLTERIHQGKTLEQKLRFQVSRISSWLLTFWIIRAIYIVIICPLEEHI